VHFWLKALQQSGHGRFGGERNQPLVKNLRRTRSGTRQFPNRSVVPCCHDSLPNHPIERFVFHAQVSRCSFQAAMTLVTAPFSGDFCNIRTWQDSGCASWCLRPSDKSHLCSRQSRPCCVLRTNIVLTWDVVEKTVAQKKAFKWLPVVIEEFCTGCGLCVEACGPACLETKNQVAVLERP
jgi:ferredoxin